MRKILLVDDDPKMRKLLQRYLEQFQYEVIATEDGCSFLAEFERMTSDLSLVILDIMLPDTDGFILCKTVRQRSNVPIVMLTASSDETDSVVGLELGADDYIAKPYRPRELLARIKAIQRRAGFENAATMRYCRFLGFTLDILERKVVNEAGELLDLTGLDYQLLKYFTEHPGEVLDRSVLCKETRGRNSGPMERSLDVQVSKLRMRLNDDSKQPSLIKTVRGSGYVFSADVSFAAA